MKKKSYKTRLNSWLNNLPIQDPVERQMASLLQVLLIGLMALVILATLVLVTDPERSAQEKLNVLINDTVGFLVVALPLGLLRRGYFRASVLIIISVLFITPALAVLVVFDLPSSDGILVQFTLAIILAGLLVSRRALILVFTLSAIVVYVSAFRENNAAPYLPIVVNFILFNGLIALFIDRFGITLRTALTNASVREGEMQSEIAERKSTVEQIQYQASILSNLEERYRTLVKNSPYCIHEIDLDGNLLSMNPAGLQMMGVESQKDIVGTPYLNAVCAMDKPRIDGLMQDAMHGEVNMFEFIADAGNNFQSNFVPLYDESGQVMRLMGITEDITERKQAEDALRVSERAYANLLKNMTGAVYRCRNDKDWTVEFISEGCIALTGYQPDDIVESRITSLGSLMHPEDVEPIWEKCQVNLAARLACSNEYRIFHRNGEMRWVWDQAQGVYSEEGELIYIEGLLTDITERKQVEEKLEWQNRRLKVLREIDTSILSADSIENIAHVALEHIRRLIKCQRAVVGLFDFETNEWIVFSISGVGDGSVPRQSRIPLTSYEYKMMEILSKNQPMLIHDLRTLEDPPVPVQRLIKEGLRSQCVLPLFSQGTLIGLLGLSSEAVSYFDDDKVGLGLDVAHQVAIAITQNNLIEALQGSNAELEKRALEREGLITELTAKNAELERFTYTVSHDLKSPLVTMKGFLGYLEEDMRSGNIDRLKDDTKRIANAVDRMTLLLNDLLELSRVGRFVNESTTLPFEELVHTALELVDGRLKEHDVATQIQPNLPIVYGDRRRLIEVLQNLIDNAAKYTEGQPNPRIEVGYNDTEDESGYAVFYVKDNGMGIAAEYHELIFGLFNKLNANSEGTGIGLALVKRIIEFHEGRIWIESEVGKGSTFFFTLPTGPSS